MGEAREKARDYGRKMRRWSRGKEEMLSQMETQIIWLSVSWSRNERRVFAITAQERWNLWLLCEMWLGYINGDHLYRFLFPDFSFGFLLRGLAQMERKDGCIIWLQILSMPLLSRKHLKLIFNEESTKCVFFFLLFHPPKNSCSTN